MIPDDMARELCAAGWEEYLPEFGFNMWRDPDRRDRICFIENAYSSMNARREWKELVQQRAQGTVTTPVVGEEEM